MDARRFEDLQLAFRAAKRQQTDEAAGKIRKAGRDEMAGLHVVARDLPIVGSVKATDLTRASAATAASRAQARVDLERVRDRVEHSKLSPKARRMAEFLIRRASR